METSAFLSGKKYAVFVFSRTTKIQFKDKLSARSVFVHLLKYSIKFTIMKSQYLSNVEIINISSIIFFVRKSHVCACCVCLYAPETKTRTWLSTNTVRLRQILRLYWTFCLLNAFWLCFVFRSFSWRAWKITALPPSSWNLWKENFAFPRNKMIGHCNKHNQLDDYGECKDGCAYWVNTCLSTKKKIIWELKKKQNKKNVLLTYIWKQANIVPIKNKWWYDLGLCKDGCVHWVNTFCRLK